MSYLTKQYKFCAAHRYWNPNWSEAKNYEIFGEDVRIHGHNYILDITINGPINEDSGFIINIFALNEIINQHVIKVMDHSQIYPAEVSHTKATYLLQHLQNSPAPIQHE